MNHVNEGTLLAIRDGELVATDHRLHVESCAQCREALDSARDRSEQIERVLADLSTPVDVDAAKRAVRARMDARRAVERPRGSSYGHLGRAAAILVVAAGAAYALPGSPVRGWLDPSPAVTGHAIQPAVDGALPVESSGIEVGVVDRLDIILRDVAEGSLIEVVLLDGDASRLSAPAGSTYSIADGRIEATLSAGPVRIELPRRLETVSIRVNGRVMMEGSVSAPDLEGVVERTGDRIVIAAPASRD